MAKKSKRFKEFVSKIEEFKEKNSSFSIDLAISALKKIASSTSVKVKFLESFDIVFNLDMKPSTSFKDVVIFPNKVRKEEKRVLVFAKSEHLMQANEAGADYAGMEYIDKIKAGWLDFDVAVATPDVMKDVAKLGSILGRRGLMPNPKFGTVTFDVTGIIKELKYSAREQFVANKFGLIHMKVGHLDMTDIHVVENIKALYKTISVKGMPVFRNRYNYLKSVYLSTTMGCSLKLSASSFI